VAHLSGDLVVVHILVGTKLVASVHTISAISLDKLRLLGVDANQYALSEVTVSK
jgi:hypothetical protein